MVDALISFALEKLRAVITDEVASLRGVTNELENLSLTLIAIQSVLEDAEMKGIVDKSARIWLGKLKDIAYDVDDILDEWRIEAQRLRGGETEASSGKVCLCFRPGLSCNHVMLRRKLGKRIKGIKERLSAIRDEESRFNFLQGRTTVEMRHRLTISEIDETRIFGRNQDREAIIGEMLGPIHGENSHVPIISLFGMGGLGKTTLAQMLYNDARVKNHFDKRMWVCVSSDFDVSRIIRDMIEAMEQDTDTKSLHTNALDILGNRLRELLDDKRFLLVLDDVWHEDEDSWDTLRLLLRSGAPASRIIATTRNEKVALKMGSTHIHRLEAMSLADSWLLFSQKANTGRTREECSNLEEIGKEIVKKCKGIPLAVKTVGSALRFQRAREDWERVLRSKTWDLPDVEEEIYPALLLSFYYLPSHLKQCFVYSSLFPKDWVIDKDMLVKLWVGQGFISTKGSRDMEDLGKEYFDDLIGRSFFESAIKDDEGKIVKCKMHDLMHDLGLFVSKGEFAINDVAKQSESNTRHSSLSGDYVKKLISMSSSNGCKLRSLLFVGESDFSELPHTFFQGFRSIRAFYLGNNHINTLPPSIEKVKQLRYLDLSHSLIEELPKALTYLYCLQTLKLNGCYKLRKLPNETRKMTSLRHLEIEDTPQLLLPEKIGSLTGLRTLSKFTEQGKSGYSVRELKELNLLQGKLEILNLELVASIDEAKEAGLANKQSLHGLHLSCKDITADVGSGLPSDVREVEERAVVVFEGLRPYRNLRDLKITNYVGNQLPGWVVDPAFRDLIRVELSGFCKCEQLPALGRLPALKYLHVQKMNQVKSVGREFCGVRGAFPRLQKLVFAHMSAWEEWKIFRDDQAMQSLLSLEIHHCRKLKCLPDCLPERLKQLSIEECDQLSWTGSLPQLEKLSLERSVGKFSKSLPRLPNLEHLEILGAQKQKSLPEGLLELKLLQTLNISFCEQISTIPKGIKRLSKLKQLTIRRCPLLAERCQKGGGDDWSKIEFIPTIEIDWKKIQWPLPLEGQFWC